MPTARRVRETQSMVKTDYIGTVRNLPGTSKPVDIITVSGMYLDKIAQRLREENARPLDPQQVLSAQMHYGVDHPISSTPLLGSAATVVVPGRVAFILKKAPWQDQGFVRSVAGYISGEQKGAFNYSEIEKTARAEAVKAAEQRTILQLKGSQHRFSIPWSNFDEKDITRFLYGSDAERVGQWFFQKWGKPEMPFDLGDSDPAGTLPYATTLTHIPPTLWERRKSVLESQIYKVIAAVR